MMPAPPWPVMQALTARAASGVCHAACGRGEHAARQPLRLSIRATVADKDDADCPHPNTPALSCPVRAEYGSTGHANAPLCGVAGKPST